MRFKIDYFVLAIIGVIALAWYFATPGAAARGIALDRISTIGVSLIFFFYGLKLSPDKMRSGLRNWKLHLLVQSATFVLFPLLVLATYPLVRPEDHVLWLSFLFLAALPSTVSSSVVMVSIARGNIPAAIFNASISGLIGIAVTPLWVGLFIDPQRTDFNLGSIYLKLLTEILLPVVLGLLLQSYCRKWVLRGGRLLSLFDRAVILLIVYKSFAQAFVNKVFDSLGWSDWCAIAFGVIALFCAVYWITGRLSRFLSFNRADRITAQFCGTKKSIVHGAVFASLLLPAELPAAVILLPLMVFHALQILITSMIAARRAQEAAD